MQNPLGRALPSEMDARDVALNRLLQTRSRAAPYPAILRPCMA